MKTLKAISEGKDLPKYCCPPLVGRGRPVTVGGRSAGVFKPPGRCGKKGNDFLEGMADERYSSGRPERIEVFLLDSALGLLYSSVRKY